MIPIGTLEIIVPESVIDVNGHTGNVQYVQWMQDAAMHHSALLGWPYTRYVEHGATWIIRSHKIEYHHSSYAGDLLHVHTWVAELKKFRSLRKFKFHRPDDDTLIAKAETLFIFCDIATGRPQTIPDIVQQSYPLVSQEDEP
ncbi:acyl-CoA thioesterase [Desulfogranum japonicum]|uniref:acyl-CoA thioesterase n=1 Tax=Desulfogranum japonicum TaxID=231447 RepID=UPI000410785B|nr:acyl-CoA thioesterase [Desulfogranum japonicum]